MKRGPQEDDRKEGRHGGVEDAPRQADLEDVEGGGRLGSLPDAQGEGREEEVARFVGHGAGGVRRLHPAHQRVRMADDLEIIGGLSAQWRSDLAAFAERAATHQWGGAGLERLVVAELRQGAIGHALREWMDPIEFGAWEREQSGRPVATGAKSFVARDGRRTAVVLPLPQRPEFLGFAAHEFLEAAQSAREEAEGFVFPSHDVHLANAHVIRSEYVVERTRLEISRALGWPQSSLDGVGLAEQVADFDQALPGLVRSSARAGYPTQPAWQHWVNIIRVFAMSAGRAAAGSAVDRAELERFYAKPLIVQTASAWHAAHDALDALSQRPHESTQTLAVDARRTVWQPLHDALLTLWRSRAGLRRWSVDHPGS